MKDQIFRTFALCTAFFLVLSVTNVSAQRSSDGISLNYILSKLTGTREVSQSQAIEELVRLIQIRKVDFALNFEDEESIKNVGANDALIKTIDENPSEWVKREVLKKYYSALSEISLSSIQDSERFLEISKQFVRIFKNDSEYETVVEYLEKKIPPFETELEKRRKLLELNAMLTDKVTKNLESDKQKKALFEEFLENYSEDTERQKIALRAAGEIVDKYGKDIEIANLIEFIKNYIPVLEKQIFESKSR